jgi:hypothetical protein
MIGIAVALPRERVDPLAQAQRPHPTHRDLSQPGKDPLAYVLRGRLLHPRHVMSKLPCFLSRAEKEQLRISVLVGSRRARSTPDGSLHEPPVL